MRESVELSPNPLQCAALFSPQAITEEMLFSTILVQTREVENVSPGSAILPRVRNARFEPLVKVVCININRERLSGA